MNEANIILDLRPLGEFNRTINLQLNGHGGGPVMDALKQIIIKIRQFWQAWWRNGGDNWLSLRPQTIRRKGHARILIETGQMISSIGRDARIQNGRIVVGIGEENAQIALWHHTGAGNLPIRKVIPNNIQQIASPIRQILETGISRQIRQINGRFGNI